MVDILASNGIEQPVVVIIAVIFMLIIIVIIVSMTQFYTLWLQAFMSNANVPLSSLMGMRLRKVDVRLVVLSKIRAVKAGLDITTNDLETHYLAGGDIGKVISALIAAKGKNLELDFRKACEIDLGGDDVLAMVHQNRIGKAIGEYELDSLIGSRGRVLTPVRPVLSCEFDGYQVECLIEGGAAKLNDEVIGVRLVNSYLVVRPVSVVS